MLQLTFFQGSGWGWLGYNKAAGKLQIAACANQVNCLRFYLKPSLLSLNIQDPLEATTGLVPLFGIDVWEHAYYLQVFYILTDMYYNMIGICFISNKYSHSVFQYKNVRPDYVKAIFDVANWKDVAARLVGLFWKAKTS